MTGLSISSYTLTWIILAMLFHFKSILNFWIWILFTMPKFILSTKQALTPWIHTALQHEASLA